MMTSKKRASVALMTIGVTLGAAACSRAGSDPMDAQLKQDLAAVSNGSIELAPKAAQSQVVVSAIEGGPQAAPARASTVKRTQSKPVTKPVAKPAPRPAERVAEAPAPAPARSPVVQSPVQPAPTPSPAPVEPAPLPRATNKPAPRQSGPYKTEAEIFRQMPWLRP